MELKDAHAERKRIYLECNNVEKALQRHVQESIEEKNIGPLIHECTKVITDEVLTKIPYLLCNYGKSCSDEVTQKESDVMSLAWKPAESIVLLTRPIENLQKLATQVGVPCTNNQILEKGFTLIRNTRDF